MEKQDKVCMKTEETTDKKNLQNEQKCMKK